MKKLILIPFLLFAQFFTCVSADKDTYIAITFDVYYSNAKEPYQYFWIVPINKKPFELIKANPVYLAADSGRWNRFLMTDTSLKDTISVWNGMDDLNGLAGINPSGTVGYVPSFLRTVMEHRVLVQKGKVRNSYRHPVLKRFSYTVKVYATPVYGEFRQFVKYTDRYCVPVYYPASEIEYDGSFWSERESEWVKYRGHFLQLPFMILSGCETSPDFSFARMYVGQ